MPQERAVLCCDPALKALVMLVSRNVFHVVSALQSVVSISTLLFLKEYIFYKNIEAKICEMLTIVYLCVDS